jgi:hypothetical protein
MSARVHEKIHVRICARMRARNRVRIEGPISLVSKLTNYLKHVTTNLHQHRFKEKSGEKGWKHWR